MNLIQRLESAGFTSFNTRRIGPCDRCEQYKQTYYIPEYKKWLCEECYYFNPENIDFINTMTLYYPTNMSALEQQLLALQAEIAQLKAKSTDNCFVGGTDNLTLKHRQLSQRGWLVPTKSNNGQGFMRAGDFPMNYFLSQDGKSIVLHQEIPVSPREAQLFKDRFLAQNMVVAKRREQAQANQSASTPPTIPTPTATAPIPTASTGKRKLSTLTGEERTTILAEAKTYSESGLYGTPKEALDAVLQEHNVER